MATDQLGILNRIRNFRKIPDHVYFIANYLIFKIIKNRLYNVPVGGLEDSPGEGRAEDGCPAPTHSHQTEAAGQAIYTCDHCW